MTQALAAVFTGLPNLAPHRVIIDMDNAEAIAVRTVSREFLGGKMRVRWCWFHVKDAVKRKLKSLGVSSRHIETVYTALHSIREAHSPDQADKQWERFSGVLDVLGLGAVKTYLESEIISKVDGWSKAYDRDRLLTPFDMYTNNLLERWHRTLKHLLLEGKKCIRLDRLLYVTTRDSILMRREDMSSRRTVAGHAAEKVVAQVQARLKTVRRVVDSIEKNRTSSWSYPLRATPTTARCACGCRRSRRGTRTLFCCA